jgi:membrane fusion protein
VLVKDGDEVTEGQPLLQITTAQVATNGQDINASIVNTLEHQKALLERQLDAQTHREQSERNRLNSLIQGTDAEIQSLTAQRETQKKRIELSETFVSSGAQLSARGYLADQELKKRQQAALEQKQVLESLDQQLASRRNQLTDSRYALEQLPVVIAEKLQILNNDLSSVQQRLAEANGRQAYVIRSPASGTVSTLQATPGQFADARRLQMEIVPSDTRLEAALFFPTRAFGFVHLGQEVRILYDAFPYQKFGTYRGHVINVSQTILTGSDAYGPITLKEPSYRVTAELERSEVDAYGRPIKLQPDMLLKADVILERRPLIRWLLDPILSARM